MGNGASILTETQLREVAQSTPFKPRDLDKLLRRYADYDSSDKGVSGISLEECVAMPEFSANKFARRVISSHLDKNSSKVSPKQFLLICSVLSNKTSALKKKEYLFEMFDTQKDDRLGHDELFQMYKTLLGSAVTDDIILDLTFRALKHPDLKLQGEITKEEFMKMIPDNEIMQRMTVDFQLG